MSNILFHKYQLKFNRNSLSLYSLNNLILLWRIAVLLKKKKTKIIDEDMTIFVITVHMYYIKLKKKYIDSTVSTKLPAVYIGNTSYLFFFHSI